MPEPVPRPAFGRVLDLLAILVAVLAFSVAAMTVLDVRGAPAAPGGQGDRAAVRLPETRRDPSPTPAGSAAIPASPARSPAPTPTTEPRIFAAPYFSGGRTYAGLAVQTDTVLTAPFDGAVEVRVYQLISGSVRVGSNIPSLPFFPYLTVTAADRRIIYRPGALGADTELLVRDGQRIGAGEPLFRQSGAGRSSWATFYDPGSPFQVVVSVQALPSGRDLDPLRYFAD